MLRAQCIVLRAHCATCALSYVCLPQGMASILEQDAVVLGDVVGEVRGQRDAHGPQTAFLAAALGPKGTET